METGETIAQEKLEPKPQESPQPPPAADRDDSHTLNSSSRDGQVVRIEPDLDFIRSLSREVGETFKMCIQCGTCSATCLNSPDPEPFPRKEMIWASWGMKDRLISDPDVWLCYQCNDCSTRCPRGARPGDVLAAMRRETVQHYAIPRFFAKWVNQPQCIPLLLGIPVALLSLALVLKAPIERFLGLAGGDVSERIVYPYSSVFPHWLLNSFFFFFTSLVIVALVFGVRRFWRGMLSTLPPERARAPARGMAASIATALKSVITHEKFSTCTRARTRRWAHLCVFFGFLALTMVTTWVITARINPLIQEEFIYPFGFWNPWKILANAGGIAILAGCALIIKDRLTEDEQAGSGTYFDWALIVTLLSVVLTGFVTEVLHYVRLEPHRHLAYFVHLVFVFTLLMYLPYSKFAHMIYRTTALVFAERTGRSGVTELETKTGPAAIFAQPQPAVGATSVTPDSMER